MKIQQTRPNKKKEKQTNTHHKHSPMNPTHDKKHDCKKKKVVCESLQSLKPETRWNKFKLVS
jgi:hypothetical protein